MTGTRSPRAAWTLILLTSIQAAALPAIFAAESFAAQFPAEELPADSLVATPDTLAVSDTLGRAPDSLAILREPLWREPERLSRDDTIGVHVDLGTRVDVTNESYYEDAFVDTTFLGRRLVDTPEERSAGVISAVLAGTRNERTAQYRLQGDASAGELLQRAHVSLAWRSAIGTDWAWFLDPRAEYRRDRTLGRDLDEWRASLGSRVRRSFGEGFTNAELGVRGDVLRTDGVPTFLLDRQTASLSLALDHLGLVGDEWRLGYRLAGRVFPDSSERDHLEHFWEGRQKFVLDGAHWLSLDATATRRVTVREVPTTRDNFWTGEATLEGRAALRGPWSVGLRGAGELTRYDLEDSTVYFDYYVLRGQLALRYERGVRWSLAIGPRGEALSAQLNPGEGYQEIGGTMELEFLGNRSWWSLTPAAGWRDYDETTFAGPGAPAFHSSFAFYEINAIADQALFSRLKLRALAAVRWERHLDPAHDARSVYGSGELLWTLR